MTCDELRPDYVPFAMGVLAEPENTEIREHLDRGCEACTPGVRELAPGSLRLARQPRVPNPLDACASGSSRRCRRFARPGGTGELRGRWRRRWRCWP